MGLLMTVETLYKYGKLDRYSEALFTSPTIWLSPPSQLNDPFECRPCFKFAGSRDQIVEGLARGLRQLHPDWTVENTTSYAEEIFLEGRHRDPNTWEGLRKDLQNALSHKIGVYCLSRNNDNILMWTHYAENHTGYCLEFEATDNTAVFGASQEVLYRDEYPVVDYYNTPKDEQVDLMLLTKYSGWSYEEEWRIIDFELGPGIREYPPQLLRGVIFGLRMPESARAMIRSLLKKRGYAVKFSEVVQDESRFKLTVKEIT